MIYVGVCAARHGKSLTKGNLTKSTITKGTITKVAITKGAITKVAITKGAITGGAINIINIRNRSPNQCLPKSVGW
jgi:hypothetical protein